MADKYLNTTGLGYYHNRIKTLFASQTDLDTLQDEVDAIVAEGGEPNVIEQVKVNGTALTPDAQKAVDVTAVQADGSGLRIPGSYGLLYSAETDGLGVVLLDSEGGDSWDAVLASTAYVDANGGKIDHIAVNGTDQPITNKRVSLTVPTVVSDLTNDSDYQTATQVTAAIDAALADVTGIDFQVVNELPATGEHGVIYLVPKTGTTGDVYDEYIWVTPESGTAHFEQIGSTQVDLSDYWSKAELVAITTAEIDALFA